MKAAYAAVGVTLGLALTGCDAGDTAPSTTGPVPEWTSELELRIGAVDDPVYALTAVTALEVGPDGSIYALHSGEALIRQFDANGAFVRSFGGRGDGPGEFQSAVRMGMVADTLWVMDLNGYRFSQYALNGRYLGGFAVPFEMGSPEDTSFPPRAEGLLADGMVWGTPPGFSHLIADGSLTHRVPMLMTRDGGVTDTLHAIPYGRAQWTVPSPNGGGLYMRQPFPDAPLDGFVLDGRAQLIIDRDAPASPAEAAYRVTKIGFGGDTIFSRTVGFDPVPVRSEALDSALEATVSMIVERGIFGLSEGRARELASDGLYRPAFRAGVRVAALGRDGTIWIMEEPGDSDTASWLVLDTGGEPMGRVSLPANLRIFQADFPFVWGVETDALEVPYVVRYRVGPSIIAMGGTADGATVPDAGAVPRNIAQHSRHERPSPVPSEAGA